MEAWANTILKVFVKILDCHILPCVLYGANFCGLKEVPEIERVHVFALKRYLNVASHTPKRRYMVKQALSLVCHHCHKSCEILAASGNDVSRKTHKEGM